MERLVCKREDGGVSIVIPAEGTSKERAEQDAANQGYTQVKWSPLEAIPTDREFRDAWKVDGPSFVFGFNFPKARDIQLAKLRIKRDELLKKYDGLSSQAMDMSDNTKLADIRSKKQELRDATNALKALSNPVSIDEIKAATPSLEGF